MAIPKRYSLRTPMLSRTRTVDSRLLQPQCVVCGYDGALLRGGRAARCARCGCDLRRRPARSYAEMEGLTGARSPSGPRAVLFRDDGERIARRWLLVLLGALSVLLVAVYLSAAAFSFF
jgi:hypothetical protein